MTFIWKYWQESLRRPKAIERIEQQIQRLSSFLSEQPFCPTYQSSIGLAQSLMKQKQVTLSRVTLLLLLQDLQRYYDQPTHRLVLMEQLVAYMGEFRYATLGGQATEQFKLNLMKDCVALFKPLQFRFASHDSQILAWVQPQAKESWVIYFNELAFAKKLQMHQLSTIASLMEYCLIHELTHWIQFETQCFEQIQTDYEVKEWHHRWHEREAMYTSERLNQNLLSIQKISTRFAEQVVQDVAKTSVVSPIIDFKMEILIPYYHQLKQRQDSLQPSFRLSL